MNRTVTKILEIGIPVLGIVATIGTKWLGKKELDDAISKKVTEALAEQTKKN